MKLLSKVELQFTACSHHKLLVNIAPSSSCQYIRHSRDKQQRTVISMCMLALLLGYLTAHSVSRPLQFCIAMMCARVFVCKFNHLFGSTNGRWQGSVSFQLQEYQTDMGRCRFDTLGKSNPALRAGAPTARGRWVAPPGGWVRPPLQ